MRGVTGRLAGTRSAGLAALFLLAACAPAQGDVPAASAQSGSAAAQSILAGSTPATGSTVSGPANSLVLRFSPPARLDEVVVTGPDGAMPMMISPVGETDRYELPLSGLGPGTYTIAWRASLEGREHRGSFSFNVR